MPCEDDYDEVSKVDSTSSNNGSSEVDARGTEGAASHCTVALAPVGRDEPYYNMHHPRRGMAIIFNHEYFLSKDLKPRTGTNVDCDSLEKTLKWLGFSVTVLRDEKLEKIRYYISRAAEADHSQHDCFFVAVLTHGELGRLHAHDMSYKPETLWQNFTADMCPSLAGKPKLFFIQACQGDELDPGVRMKAGGRTETDGRQNAEYKIPVQADFLIAYSTVPGYYSWRNTTRGSWFIQALVEILRSQAFKYDLLTLLTLVNQKVALNYESNTPDCPMMHQQKQISCFTSMLTRLFMFNEK